MSLYTSTSLNFHTGLRKQLLPGLVSMVVVGAAVAEAAIDSSRMSQSPDWGMLAVRREPVTQSLLLHFGFVPNVHLR
jgi:hypothetical protein